MPKIFNFIGELKQNGSRVITTDNISDHAEIYVGNGDMPANATMQIILDGSNEEQNVKNELIDYIDKEIEKKIQLITWGDDD